MLEAGGPVVLRLASLKTSSALPRGQENRMMKSAILISSLTFGLLTACGGGTNPLRRLLHNHQPSRTPVHRLFRI
jgi:hypothetical protein